MQWGEAALNFKYQNREKKKKESQYLAYFFA